MEKAGKQKRKIEKLVESGTTKKKSEGNGKKEERWRNLAKQRERWRKQENKR